jgi:hypothetical protein
MNYKKDEGLIKKLRASSQSITETAKKYAAYKNIGYTDQVRRSISQLLNEGGKTQKGENTKWEEDLTKGTAYNEFTVSKPIKTLDEALASCKADLNKWEVERWVCNSWGVTAFRDNPNGTYRTNYQVKVWFKKKQTTLDERMATILPSIKDYVPKKIFKTANMPHKIGVVSFADFHIGADIKNLLKTKDFNLDILIDYLHQATDIINSHNYSEVHVNLLGDFFESLSGMNHENTFKSLGQDMWGANVMIVANEVIGTHLLSRIHNLTQVNIVSGNHDRMTSSNKLDNTGEGGKVLWYMLTKDFPEIVIDYHNSVLTKEIDGINYLLTHGDKGYSKKDFSKFVADYGKSGIYNLIMEGHLHTRKTKKTMAFERKYYQDVEVVSFDDSTYRKLIVPSLFTGNWFSESLGFGGNAGFVISENNGKGCPHVFDYTL